MPRYEDTHSSSPMQMPTGQGRQDGLRAVSVGHRGGSSTSQENLGSIIQSSCSAFLTHRSCEGIHPCSLWCEAMEF